MTHSISNHAVLESLRNKPFSVLNDGHVILMDVMGDESDIAQAARTSYGKGTKPVSDDITLIRYLMRHKHTTPLEMAVIKLHVRVPMDCWRQWIRHRTANVNEYSTRYSEAIDSCQTTRPDDWRVQSTTNKQGSGTGTVEWPESYLNERSSSTQTAGEFLSNAERDLQQLSHLVYQARLEFGVSREQARKDLPLSTYTEAIWKCDLHNLLHFLELRMHSHAQKEIRDYATIIGEQIVRPLFPNVWQAFIDYRLEALTLTRLDQIVLRFVLFLAKTIEFESYQELFDKTITTHVESGELPADWSIDKRCRERDECCDKLSRLFGFSE